MSARRQGTPDVAAIAWRRFLALAPHDSRAGLASFELGRLEMDVRKNPRAAREALEQALSAAPGAAFEEDALARLVRLHALAQDRQSCRAMLARYLERYPAGTYRASLQDACGG